MYVKNEKILIAALGLSGVMHLIRLGYDIVDHNKRVRRRKELRETLDNYEKMAKLLGVVEYLQQNKEES